MKSIFSDWPSRSYLNKILNSQFDTRFIRVCIIIIRDIYWCTYADLILTIIIGFFFQRICHLILLQNFNSYVRNISDIHARQNSFFQMGGDGDKFNDRNASQIAVSKASLTFFCAKKLIEP